PPAGSARVSATAGWAESVSRSNLSPSAASAVLSIIFFTWGALTSLNDVLIPHLKAVFDMNYARTMLIQFTFFSTYLVMSLPAGRVSAHVGYKPSIVIGLLIAALGALAFYPAAKVPSYPLFLLALFVLATGITLLQVAANPYISLLGEPRGASSRLTLAQALNSLGHTLSPALIGPLILSVAVLGGAELARLPQAQQQAYRLAQAQSVQLPYLAVAGALLLLAGGVYLFGPPRVLLCVFALVGIALLATTILGSGALAMWSVIATGAFNSIMFPALFTLGIEGLGPLTPKASSLLVMAIFGGAVIPQLQGVL